MTREAENTDNHEYFSAFSDKDKIISKVNTNYISITQDISVRQAMKSLINQAAENDNISTVYVVSNNGNYVGAIDLKDLIIAREGVKLYSIISNSHPYVYSDEPIDDCIERIKEYQEDSIPMLDKSGKLVGVLTSQDITRLIEEEYGEDYAKFAGLSAAEDITEPLTRSVIKRLPWLMVLLVLGLIVSAVVGVFENVVSHLTVIVSFQSLILGMAGNAGTQSLAITIRSLTDEHINDKQKLSLIFKEARIGLINGMVLGILSFLFIGGYLTFLRGETVLLSFSVSLCTGAALIVSVMLSSVSGTVIPLIFKKFNIDPAVASGPLITTLNDLVAVISYYGLAWILLINFMKF